MIKKICQYFFQYFLLLKDLTKNAIIMFIGTGIFTFIILSPFYWTIHLLQYNQQINNGGMKSVFNNSNNRTCLAFYQQYKKYVQEKQKA